MQWKRSAGRALGTVCLVLAANAQQQPIEYPHNKHIALGLACIDCHSTADTHAEATIPSIRKCMLCHDKVANEGPGVQKLTEFAASGREVPWQRVYGFAKRAAVKFQHAPHIRAEVSCATCHGDVASMTTATKAVNHTMGTCLNCHRQKSASEDCVACHF